MRMIYFKWSPVSTIVLIVTIGLLAYYIISKGTVNVSGFLGIMMLFIARGIMWEGWYMEKNQELQDKIDFLQTQVR